MAEDYPVNIVFDAIDQVTKPVRRINDQIERMGGPIREFNNRMRALSRESGFDRVADSGRHVLNRLGGVRDAAGQVATRLSLMGGAAAFGMDRMFTSVGRTAEEVQVLSNEVGAGVGWLQEWGYVAEQAGVPQDRLNESMREFNGRLGELRSGGGPLLSGLKEMNPALAEQLKNTQSLEEAWSLYMDAMERAPNEQARAALASAAFSDEGRVLGNIAELGSERVTALRERGRRFGQILGESTIESGRRYLNEKRNLFAALSGLAVVVSSELLPVFNDLFSNLTDWIVDNRGEIKEWASQFADKLPGYLKRIQEIASSVFDTFSDVFGGLTDTFGTANTIIGTLAITIGGPLIAAVASAGAALTSLGVALAATPIGWFLGGVALIAGAAYLIYRNWDSISSFFTDKFEDVRKAFDDGLVKGVMRILHEFNPVRIVAEATNSIIEYLTGVDLAKAGRDLFQSLWDGIVERWNQFTGWLKERLASLTDLVPDWLQNWFADDGDKEVVVRHESAGGAAAGARSVPSARASVVEMQKASYRSGQRSWMTVDMKNVPRGTRVERGGDEDDGVDVNVGYQMGP